MTPEHARLMEAATKALKTLNEYKERHLVPAYFLNALADLRKALNVPPAATPTPVEQDCSRLENWPIPDVLNHLVNATEHLLHHHDCDEHGHETWKYAAEAARKHVAQLSATAPPSLAAREAAEEIHAVVLTCRAMHYVPSVDRIESVITRHCSPVPAAGGSRLRSKGR